MSVRAGASLPGPFFITFPIGGPLTGLVGLALAPMILMIWLVYAFAWFGWMLIRDIAIPALQTSVEYASAAVDNQREHQLDDRRARIAHQARIAHDAIPSNRRGLTADERAFLDSLDHRS